MLGYQPERMPQYRSDYQHPLYDDIVMRGKMARALRDRGELRARRASGGLTQPQHYEVGWVHLLTTSLFQSCLCFISARYAGFCLAPMLLGEARVQQLTNLEVEYSHVTNCFSSYPREPLTGQHNPTTSHLIQPYFPAISVQHPRSFYRNSAIADSEHIYATEAKGSRV